MANAGGLSGPITVQQDPVAPGALPDVTGVNPLGASDSAAQQYEAGLQSALTSLQQRANAPNMYNVAAGFLTPGPGGFFGELGHAAQAMAQWQEQQRQMQIPIARLKIQMAINRLAQNKAQDALARTASTNPANPSAVANTTTQNAWTGTTAFPSNPAAIPGEASQAAQTAMGTGKAAAQTGQTFGSAPTPVTPPMGAQQPRSTPPMGTPQPMGTPPDLTAAPGTFHIAGAAPGDISAATEAIGSIYKQMAAGNMTPQQGASIVQDMLKRGSLAPGIAVPVEQAIVQGKPNPIGDVTPAAVGAAPSAGSVQTTSQAPATPAAMPTDLSALPPQQLTAMVPQLLQGASYTGASYNTPAGTAFPQEQANQDTMTQLAAFGNPATLAGKTNSITNVLDDIQKSPTAMAQFNDVVGLVARKPALMQAILHAVPTVGAHVGGVGAQGNLEALVAKYIPPQEQGMANVVVQGIAQSAALEAQLRGMKMGNMPVSEADVLTAGLTNGNLTPPVVLENMLQTLNNVNRLHALAQGYSQLNPYLQKTPDGA
ncbi:MAG: hypothetical protein WC829_01405, partial [Hyphomicrobium sp.]